MPLPREDVEATTPKFLRDKYAIVGVGETEYMRGSDKSTRALASIAVRNAMADAGLKASSVDSGMPVVWQREGLTYSRASDEHGVLDIAGAAPTLGEKVFLVPGHCDPTVNLYDWYVGVRGFDTPAARVEALWPIAARGATT